MENNMKQNLSIYNNIYVYTYNYIYITEYNIYIYRYIDISETFCCTPETNTL